MESGMKVWELIAWLESHAEPDDDVVLAMDFQIRITRRNHVLFCILRI